MQADPVVCLQTVGDRKFPFSRSGGDGRLLGHPKPLRPDTNMQKVLKHSSTKAQRYNQEEKLIAGPVKDLLLPGELVKERWRVIRKLGGGGFGEIYEAVDTRGKCEPFLTDGNTSQRKAGDSFVCLNCAAKTNGKQLSARSGCHVNPTDATSDDMYKFNPSAVITDSGIGCQQNSSEVHLPFSRVNSAGTTTSGSFSSKQTVFTNPDSQHPGAPLISPCCATPDSARPGKRFCEKETCGASAETVNEKYVYCCAVCGLPVLLSQLRCIQPGQRTNENCTSSDSGISTAVLESVDYRVAVKVESNRQPRQVLRMEVAVLRRLQGKPNVCTLYGCGKNTRFNYMVMSLQGKNLAELRRCLPTGVFTPNSAFRLVVQCLDAIQTLHDAGFLHRDIKPSNFAIQRRRKEDRLQVTVLDFGLARPYTVSGPGSEVRNPRPVAGFRGTVRYASVHAHEHRDLSRRDDLWSLFYMLVEFICGQLPWRRIRDKDLVGQMKAAMDHKEMALKAGIHRSIAECWVSHLFSLDYRSRPDYDLLKHSLTTWLTEHKVQWTERYDWEERIALAGVAKTSSDFQPGQLRRMFSQNEIDRKFTEKQCQELQGVTTLKPVVEQNSVRDKNEVEIMRQSKWPGLLKTSQSQQALNIKIKTINRSQPQLPQVTEMGSRERSDRAIVEDLGDEDLANLHGTRYLDTTRHTYGVEAPTEMNNQTFDGQGPKNNPPGTNAVVLVDLKDDGAGNRRATGKIDFDSDATSSSSSSTPSLWNSENAKPKKRIQKISEIPNINEGCKIKFTESGDRLQNEPPADFRDTDLVSGTEVEARLNNESTNIQIDANGSFLISGRDRNSKIKQASICDGAVETGLRSQNLTGELSDMSGTPRLMNATKETSAANPRAKIQAIIQNLLAKQQAELNKPQSKPKVSTIGEKTVSLVIHPCSSSVQGKATGDPTQTRPTSVPSRQDIRAIKSARTQERNHSTGKPHNSSPFLRLSSNSSVLTQSTNHHTFLRVVRPNNLSSFQASAPKQEVARRKLEEPVRDGLPAADSQKVGTEDLLIAERGYTIDSRKPAPNALFQVAKPTPLPRRRRSFQSESKVCEMARGEVPDVMSKEITNSLHISRLDQFPLGSEHALDKNDYLNKLALNKRRHNVHHLVTPVGPMSTVRVKPIRRSNEPLSTKIHQENEEQKPKSNRSKINCSMSQHLICSHMLNVGCDDTARVGEVPVNQKEVLQNAKTECPNNVKAQTMSKIYENRVSKSKREVPFGQEVQDKSREHPRDLIKSKQLSIQPVTKLNISEERDSTQSTNPRAEISSNKPPTATPRKLAIEQQEQKRQQYPQTISEKVQRISNTDWNLCWNGKPSWLNDPGRDNSEGNQGDTVQSTCVRNRQNNETLAQTRCPDSTKSKGELNKLRKNTSDSRDARSKSVDRCCEYRPPKNRQTESADEYSVATNSENRLFGFTEKRVTFDPVVSFKYSKAGIAHLLRVPDTTVHRYRKESYKSNTSLIDHGNSSESQVQTAAKCEVHNFSGF